MATRIHRLHSRFTTPRRICEYPNFPACFEKLGVTKNKIQWTQEP